MIRPTPVDLQGISVPVLYDHFESKQGLHKRLLERHFAGETWQP